MKSSTLLLITIFFFLNYFSYSIKVNPNSNEQYENYSSRCFNDLDGYTTEFQANSFKANYPVGPNQIMPISYSEIGKLSVSMKDQMMFVHFKIFMDNILEGKFWGFQSNNTQYILMNINGTDTCVSQELQYPLPSKLQVEKIGKVNLGQTKCDIFQIKNGANYSSQQLLVDSKNCAFMSSSVQNPPNTTAGYALINFYNFERKYHHSTFQLPSECLSSSSSSSSNLDHPKFLKHFNNFNNNQQ